MDIYVCELPNSEEGAKPDSPLIFELASSKPSLVESTRAIQRKVERAAGLNSCSRNSTSAAIYLLPTI